MSFGQGKTEFQKFYPIVDKWAYIWLVSAVVILALDVVVFVLADFPNVLSLVITIVAMVGVFGVCVVGFVLKIIQRKKLLNQVILFKDGVVYLDTTNRYREHILSNLVENIKLTNYPKLVKETLAVYKKSYSTVKIEEIIFAYLKRPKEIEISNFGRKPKKVAGSQSGYRIELSWDGVLSQTLSLICHEVGHVVIYESGDNFSELEQHRIFQDVHLDSAWKGKK